MELPVVGDRIELLEMGLDPRSGKPDPSPMESGSTGTVRSIHELPWAESHQICVNWDPEVQRSLALIVPPDHMEREGHTPWEDSTT